MKRFMIAAAFAAAPLAACSTPVTEVVQSTPVVAQVCSAADRTLIDEKVVFASETLFNIPAQAYVEAVKDGHLPVGPLRTSLKAKLIKLDELRNAIFDARGTVNCDFASMKKLHTDIMLLIPRN